MSDTEVKVMTVEPVETPSSKKKKKRNLNFSREEVYCLVMEYGKRLNKLNFGNREQKQNCWDEIGIEINNLHSNFKRSVDEIKKKWIDLLYATKKEYITATKVAKANGEPRPKLSEISELIVKVRGGFSSKPGGKHKSENGVHIINLQIPTGEGSEQPTTIYIPHVEECQSSTSESGAAVVDGESILIADAFNEKGDLVSIVEEEGCNISSQEAEEEATATIIGSGPSYESYSSNSVLAPLSPPHPSRCSCGLSADVIRLKQETLGVLRRKVQILEERRIQEKQKWWEEKAVLRLQRQKLELEIKQLQNSLRQSETTAIVRVQAQNHTPPAQ